LQTSFRDDFEQWIGMMQELRSMVSANPAYGDIKNEVMDLFKDFPSPGQLKD